MSIDGTSKIVASITALVSVCFFALATSGCDKGSSGESDQAEAESPEKEAESTDSGTAGKQQAKSQKKTEGKAGKKMKPGAARKMKMKKKAPDIEVTEKDLENFAKVQMRMKDYAETEGLKDKKPKGKKEKIKMMMKMKKKATSVMDEIGMDKKRYAKIGRKMRSDSELQKRLDKKIQSMQGSEGDGSSGESGSESESGGE